MRVFIISITNSISCDSDIDFKTVPTTCSTAFRFASFIAEVSSMPKPVTVTTSALADSIGKNINVIANITAIITFFMTIKFTSTLIQIAMYNIIIKNLNIVNFNAI